ncbi:hypothetical protein R6Q59_026467 [Mikania micrantha]
MDFMDIDQIEEVPDTPEKFIKTSNNDGNNTGKHSNGSSSCRVIDRDYFNQKLRNEPREKGKSDTFMVIEDYLYALIIAATLQVPV